LRNFQKAFFIDASSISSGWNVESVLVFRLCLIAKFFSQSRGSFSVVVKLVKLVNGVFYFIKTFLLKPKGKKKSKIRNYNL